MCYTWKLAGESSLLGSQKLSVFHNKTTTTTTTTKFCFEKALSVNEIKSKAVVS